MRAKAGPRRGASPDPDTGTWSVTVWSPDTAEAWLVAGPAHGPDQRIPMRREGATWTAELPGAEDGWHYHLEVDGIAPLLDPWATAVTPTPIGFRCVLRTRPWPKVAQLHEHPAFGPDSPDASPVVYELHVRGFGRTFSGVAARLDHLVDLGVDVVELMPVHPFDATINYWGYMPLVWGAVHEGYADLGRDPVDELAAFVAAAHARHIAVWLDVVFNHTAEEDEDVGVTTSWRGLAPTRVYRRHDGRFTNDSGCGNDIEPAESEVRRLVIESLNRFADMGVDGFRFDLASILARDGGELVRRIGDWATERGVVLVAEPWDLGAYQVGGAFPDGRWSQWNDRFRDDVRGFLRAEPGLVPAMIHRISGSPDLFPDEPWRSLNFVTAHDGLTMHDLTAVTSDQHRSWDCGPHLRMQQLKNAFCYLLLSAGVPMFVMGDEMGRTQQNDPNPYAVDSPVTWVDWARLEDWRELYEFVGALIGLRRTHPIIAPEFHGTTGGPDVAFDSRSLAWSSGDLLVMANTWWEPTTFTIPLGGTWTVVLQTVSVGVSLDPAARTVQLPPRSIAILVRQRHDGGPG